MREREISYTTLKRDGRCVTIELWPNAEAGLMLFYPGTMLSPIQYRPMLAALHEAGFAVAGLHLTGHGLNPHSARFSFEDLLKDGLDAEEWLRNAGFAQIAVCGHSQGGILTLAHAAASRRLTAAFPICGILPQRPEAIELTLFRALGSRRAALMTWLNALARWLPRLPLPVSAYLSLRRISANARHIRMNRQKSRVSYPLSYVASLFNARLSRHLQCPLFFFNARDDALFTPALAGATFQFLHAPQKHLIWLPGGGHLAALNPALCRYTARIAAAACAGLGLPLHLETSCPAEGAKDGI
ncbi:alpha/beta fold hydrolase [Desulfovibrio sp. ZJ200]|uniref:alpha/beta hydrolase n=1 Tax=Desulfovibrio sp. ZJ200 TaxID=2709792 RepID=UPI0013ED0E6E|nr:alpha/beta fold hydrolase [Desulfovibrio sp. ZJ200]